MLNGERYEKALKMAQELLSEMSLTEKIGQISQFGTSIYTNDEQVFEDHFAEGKVGSYLTIKGAEKTNRIQELLLSITKIKIPALFADDVIHGYRTTAPTPLAQSCTWEPELAKKCCEVAAKEAYSAGLKWTFAPMVDIARDPRWGRIVEGYGEDTFLCSDFAAASVKGFQGDYIGEKDHVLACMKHYVAYGACVGGRDYDSVDMSLQTLYDVYLPSFKAGIDAGAATVMSAFNDVNGVPCTGNKFLLRDVLRDKLGFKGFVVSDANAVMELVAHGYAKDAKDAAEKAFGGGVDMIMAGDLYNNALPELIKEGKIDKQLVDDSVLTILTIKYMLGLFDEPTVDPEGEKCFFAPEHRQAARECAKNAIVLLENNGILPLKGDKKIALIGPVANEKHSVLGTWSCYYDDNETVTVAKGLSEALGCEIETAIGCGFGNEETAVPDEEMANAEKLAKTADIIIAAVGESAGMSGEAASRSRLDIPGKQKELIDMLLATGKPVILLVSAGRPLVLTEYMDKAAAIVYMWQLGTETGHAVADVLTGKHNPSGRLTTSFPRSLGQIPVYYNRYNTGRPPLDRVHYEAKYKDEKIPPAYPFGYGLSYTCFEYSNLVLSEATMTKYGKITVNADVENTGKYDGYDVVELYVRDLVGSRVRPIKELKGYKKLYIKAGEKKTVTFTLTAKSLAFTNNEMQKVTEPGDFKLWVAHNSADEALCADFTISE